MNFQQLEYIIGVDTHKHFGHAAESCHVTQATLSAMIKKLEIELDLIIFDRSKSPVKTTEEGLQVIEIAKRILSERNELFELKEDQNKELKGTMKIGIIPTVASSLLSIVLPILLEK